MPITGSQRHFFDIPDDVTYLNAAYLAPQLRERRAAGMRASGGIRFASPPTCITISPMWTGCFRCSTRFSRKVLRNPPAGRYTVRVSAPEVHQLASNGPLSSLLSAVLGSLRLVARLGSDPGHGRDDHSPDEDMHRHQR